MIENKLKNLAIGEVCSNDRLQKNDNFKYYKDSLACKKYDLCAQRTIKAYQTIYTSQF